MGECFYCASRTCKCDGGEECAAYDAKDKKIKTLRKRVAKLESNIALTLERWAEETGDGSMWGADAYVLAPIGDVSEPEQRSANEYRDARKCVKELEGNTVGYAVATRTAMGVLSLATPVFATASEAGFWADLHTNLGIAGNPRGFMVRLVATKGGT